VEVDHSRVSSASLTQLRLRGGPGMMLSRAKIAWISSVSTIRSLDLSGWMYWFDLQAIWCLPIEELVSDQGVQLLRHCFGDPFGDAPGEPRSLRHLRSLTLNARVTKCNRFGMQWNDLDAEKARHIATSLLSLPAFETLTSSEYVAERDLRGKGLGGYRGTQAAEGVLKGIEAWVEAVVGVDRARWDCVFNKGHGRVYRVRRE